MSINAREHHGLVFFSWIAKDNGKWIAEVREISPLGEFTSGQASWLALNFRLQLVSQFRLFYQQCHVSSQDIDFGPYFPHHNRTCAVKDHPRLTFGWDPGASTRRKRLCRRRGLRAPAPKIQPSSAASTARLFVDLQIGQITCHPG